MKTKYFFIAITLLFSQIGICQTAINGKVDNYPGKANDILVNPFFPENLGKINVDGEFTASFDERYIKKLKNQIEELRKKGKANITRSTLKSFQTRFQCEDDAFSFTNGEEPYTELLATIGFMVGNLKSQQVDGVINIVNSKDFAKSQVFNPQNDPTVGFMLDWYYIEKPAKVEGNCTTRMSTGSGDETYDRNIRVALNFKPGWNLVKYDISKVFTGKAGDKFTQNASYSSIDSIPENVKFVYSEK